MAAAPCPSAPSGSLCVRRGRRCTQSLVASANRRPAAASGTTPAVLGRSVRAPFLPCGTQAPLLAVIDRCRHRRLSLGNPQHERAPLGAVSPAAAATAVACGPRASQTPVTSSGHYASATSASSRKPAPSCAEPPRRRVAPSTARLRPVGQPPVNLSGKGVLPVAVRRQAADGGRRGTRSDHSGGGVDSGPWVTTAAAALNQLVLSAHSWSEAAQLLEVAGGPMGRPPPAVQLALLLQSRRFQEGSAAAARVCVGAADGGGGDWVPKPRFVDDAADAPAAAAEDDAVWAAFGPAPEQQLADAGRGDEAAEAMARHVPRRGRAVRAWNSPMAAGATAAVQEDLLWQAEWELDWEAQLQRHAPWPPQPPPPPSVPAQTSSSPELRPTAAAAARTSAAVILPGHAAAAAAAAAAARAASVVSHRVAAPEATAAASEAGLTRFSPIPPMRMQAGQSARGLPVSFGAWSPASEPMRGRQKPQSTAPSLLQHRPQQPQRTPPPANAPRSDGEGGRAAADGGAAGLAAAAAVLLRVVNDAAVVQPNAWTNEEVATLLRRAAKLAYRYPGLLPATTAAGGARQDPQPAGEAAAPLPPRPSYKRNSAVGVLPWGPWAVNTKGQRGPSGGERDGVGGAAVGSQLRVRLQQVLLRVDGMLVATPERQPRAQPSAAAASIRPRLAPEAAATPPPRLSAPAAAAAAWAAAALQLRLSPEGDVRRRLLEELRPRLRLQLERGRRRSLAVAPEEHERRGRRRRRQPVRWRAAGGSRRAPATATGSLGAGEVADVLWAFAVLGLQMTGPQLDRALRVVSAGPRSPSTTLRLARLPRGRRQDARSRRRPPAPSPPGGRPAPAGAAGSAAGPAGLPSAASAAAARHTRLAATTAVAGSAGGLEALRPSQLTGVAWAAVQLGEGGGREGVTGVWAARLFGATQTRLARLSPSQLVDLVWSVGRGRRMPTGRWRRAAAAALTAAAPRLAPWQLARAAAALAKLRIPAPYTMVSSLLSSLHSQLPASLPSDVAAMVWALPYITYPYTELFVRRHRRMLLDLAIATQRSLLALEPAQLVQLADGFARLRQLPGAEWMRMHRESCIRLKHLFSEPNRRKIRLAYATMLGL